MSALRLRPASAIRARKHPLAVAFAWLFEATFAVALAHPFYASIRGVYGAHPDGDLPLFSPDGLEIAELFMRSEGTTRALVASSTWVLAIAVVLGHVRLGALVAALALEREDELPLSGRDALGRGAVRLFPLLGVQALGALFGGALLALGMGLAGKLHAHLLQTSIDARADRWAIAVVVPFVLLALTTSVALDLARVGVVVTPGRARDGLRLGLRAFAKRPGAAIAGWSARAALGVVPVVLAAIVASRLGGRPGASLALVLAAHQIAIAARVALRASWLAHAARIVAASRPAATSAAPPAAADASPEPEAQPEGGADGGDAAAENASTSALATR